MSQENQKTQQEVMPSVANFLSDVWFEGEFKNQPLYLQEIFELVLETETGNNLNLRLKMLSCLRTSRNLARTLAPFSNTQIVNACNIMAAAKTN
ncbi:MAG: hypothetical protein EOO44_18590 [Flavobacterium sp.]|nr:MAG: hypothetical protein EOO44_18590 [Flavobacterium sp.]